MSDRQIGPYLAAKTKSAILAAASSCSAGMACEWVSRVMETVR
jgi:hypothetical protein